MQEDIITRNAVERFLFGFNCAESVLMAGCELLEIDSDLVPEIATGFGAGIGRRGSLCGAVSGAVMVIGLKFGRTKAAEKEGKESAYSKALEFYRRFEDKFGSAICYQLTGCDLTADEGRKKFGEMNVPEKKCAKFVETACKILIDLFCEGQIKSRKGCRKSCG